MPVKRIPLLGSLTNRNANPNSFTAKDQRFENCYPEINKNPVTGKATAYLYKRLGTAHSAAAGGSYVGGSGACVWNTNSSGSIGVFPFLDGANLKLYSSAAALIGTQAGIVGTGAFVNETLISGVSNLTVLAAKSSDNRTHAWFLPESGGFTEITDGDFPPNQGTPLTIVGDFAHMDGYAFVMDSLGQIWNSDLNSLANWTAASMIPANSYPDGGSGVVRTGDYIAALGLNSIEFYRNGGNPSGSPLSRVPGATKRIRCVQAATPGFRTCLNVGDDVFFVGGPADSGSFGVYKLNGLSEPVKISTPAVDKLIDQAMTASFAGSFVMHGMTHLMVTISTTYSLCLCLDTGIWWYFIPAAAYSFGSALGITGVAYFTNSVTAGKGVYSANPASPVFQDDSVTFTRTIQTENIDFGTNNRKFVNAIDFIGDTQTVSGNEAISISYDDFANFGSVGNIDFSTASRRLTGFGSGSRFSIKISGAINAPSRLEVMDIDYEVGSV